MSHEAGLDPLRNCAVARHMRGDGDSRRTQCCCYGCMRAGSVHRVGVHCTPHGILFRAELGGLVDVRAGVRSSASTTNTRFHCWSIQERFMMFLQRGINQKWWHLSGALQRASRGLPLNQRLSLSTRFNFPVKLAAKRCDATEGAGWMSSS